MQMAMGLSRRTKMEKNQKRTVFAIGIISALAMIAFMAYPVYSTGVQANYQYSLDQKTWSLAAESMATVNTDPIPTSVHTVTIDAKGYAFLRIDNETIKQYKAETSIVVTIQPATETGERKVDVTGSVTVNDVFYNITGGKAFLETQRRLVFLNCTGIDQGGNQITLKLGARYFWWGGEAYALRSAAVLHTADKPMLLLQRGIARLG